MLDSDLQTALATLKRDWGIQARRLTPLLEALETHVPATTDDLIAASRLSHRSVALVLSRLEPWLERTDQGVTLRHDQDPPSTRPRGGQVEGPSAASGPALSPALDHVRATAATIHRRARYMADSYALDGARVLFLGDHDLTSLALAAIAPACRVVVVDVDDGVLEHVARAGHAMGRDIECLFADLRVSLPEHLAGTVDLAFTDPPYTPEGIALFAARACQALRCDGRSRLLLCHGFADARPDQGLGVQAALHELHLLIEAVTPGFNAYAGAPAIGSASSLFVLRPLPGTWKRIERALDRAADSIYTRGPMSAEAGERPPPPGLVAALQERLASPGGRPALLAGPGWPALDGTERISLRELWRRDLRHATSPPGRRQEPPALTAVNLALAPWLATRLPLIHRGAELWMAVPPGEAGRLLDPVGWRMDLLSSVYELTQAGRWEAVTLIRAIRRPGQPGGPGHLARALIDHSAATVASALREAVIAASRLAGATMTKNQARALLSDVLALTADARTADLPLDVLSWLTAYLPNLEATLARAIPARGERPGPPGRLGPSSQHT